MKVNKDNNLMLLASASGLSPEKASENITSELINRGIVEDIPENWGESVFECCNRDIAVDEVVDVVRSIGINPISCEHLQSLFACTLIGDGDCPVCGGCMEVTDGEYKQVAGFDYDSEPEYEPVWEEKTCKHCGYIESNGIYF